MICSSVYRDRFIRPSPSGPDSTSSRLIFRGACHAVEKLTRDQRRECRRHHFARRVVLRYLDVDYFSITRA
jgi:hypothetical protein